MRQTTDRENEIARIMKILKGLSDKDIHMMLSLASAFERVAKEK